MSYLGSNSSWWISGSFSRGHGMGTSTAEVRAPSAIRARILNEAVIVDLRDGRTVTAPLTWYPRLLHGNARERRNWRLIGGGVGIHWPDLDEDVSVGSILAGRPSAESQASLKKWLDNRKALANKQRRPARANSRTQSTRRRARG
jgi:hypothetical protein